MTSLPPPLYVSLTCISQNGETASRQDHDPVGPLWISVSVWQKRSYISSRTNHEIGKL